MSNYKPKFAVGDTVQARNGRGSFYEITAIRPDTYTGGLQYLFDNGAVNIKKRARSGFHAVERADKGYRKV